MKTKVDPQEALNKKKRDRRRNAIKYNKIAGKIVTIYKVLKNASRPNKNTGGNKRNKELFLGSE